MSRKPLLSPKQLGNLIKEVHEIKREAKKKDFWANFVNRQCQMTMQDIERTLKKADKQSEKE